MHPTEVAKITDPVLPEARASGWRRSFAISELRSFLPILPAHGSSAALKPSALIPVVSNTARLTAMLVDGALLAFAMCLFVGVLLLCSLQAVLATFLFWHWSLVALLLGEMYFLLFAFAETQTPGQAYAGLQVCGFDGTRARVGARLHRLALMHAAIFELFAAWRRRRLSWVDTTSRTYLKSVSSR